MNFVMMMNDSSKGLFLIFLVIICNFLADLMNCSVQKGLIEHPFLKWATVIILIFFTINFTSDPKMNPNVIALNSFLIFILFVLFMKQNKYTFFVSLCLLMIIFYMNQWINYYKLQEEPDQKKIKDIQTACLSMQIILLITLTAGTLLYFNQQYTERKENFQLAKFFFGTNKCDGIVQQKKTIMQAVVTTQNQQPQTGEKNQIRKQQVVVSV